MSKQEIDSNDVRISNVGLIIHVASRIYYSKGDELITLLEHLDCQTIKEFKIWEIYFLYRINKIYPQLNVLKKDHFLCRI